MFYEKIIQEAISVHSKSFYWGKGWSNYRGHSIVNNIVSGYALSKPFWYRVFMRRKLRYQCATLHLLLQDWLSKDIDEEYILNCTKYKSLNMKKIYNMFLDYRCLYDSSMGAFKELYIWDMYLVLIRCGFIRSHILEEYKYIKW